MLRDGEGHPMDRPVLSRVVTWHLNPDTIRGQRGSHQDDKNANIPSANPPYRTQTPFYPGISGSETDLSQRNPRQREPSGSPNKTTPDDELEEMDEGDIQQLIDEWLNEEVLF